MGGTTDGIFPKQNIPEVKKDKDWTKKNIEAMLSYQNYTTEFNSERKKDYENYLLFNGVFDTKQFEYVTNTYGITSPARLVNHPIIAPKIDRLVGEFMSNELDFTVEAINEEATIRKLDKKVAIVSEKVLQEVRKEIQNKLGIEFDSNDLGMEIPDDVDKFLHTNFREQVEICVFYGLKYIIEKYHLQHTFKQGLYDLCIISKEFYHCSIVNGDPKARRVDPRALIWDINLDIESLEDASWVAEERFLTINEIIDEFGDYLTRDEVIKIEALRYLSQDALEKYNKPYQWYYRNDSQKSLRIRCVSAAWKSIKALKFKLTENKHDPELPFRKRVPDDYKAKKGENIQTKTVNDVRIGTMIGHEIIVNARSMPNQIRRSDNYAQCKLPYTGVINKNFDGLTLSIVDTLKNIQLMYNIVMFHIELTLSRAGGKAVVYDVSQKPNNLALDDVFFHAKNSGIIPINTKQEGNQIGGASGFNQFQQIDFTLSNSVSQLINLKVMLENTAEYVTGISNASMGMTRTDAVGVNERNVIQSSLVTQPLFSNHSRTISMVLQQLSDLMKIAWPEGKAVYWMGDSGAKFITMEEGFNLDDYAIYARNTAKDKKDKETILGISQQVLSSSGAEGMLSLIKIINSANSKDAESILEAGIDIIKKQQAEQQQAQNESNKAMIDAKNKENEDKITMARESNQTKIRVAEIMTSGKLNDTLTKIEGGQETQDFRQQHDKAMALLESETRKAEQAQSATIDNEVEENKLK